MGDGLLVGRLEFAVLHDWVAADEQRVDLRARAEHERGELRTADEQVIASELGAQSRRLASRAGVTA